MAFLEAKKPRKQWSWWLTTKFRKENPSQITIHLHQVWSTPKLVIESPLQYCEIGFWISRNDLFKIPKSSFEAASAIKPSLLVTTSIQNHLLGKHGQIFENTTHQPKTPTFLRWFSIKCSAFCSNKRLVKLSSRLSSWPQVLPITFDVFEHMGNLQGFRSEGWKKFWDVTGDVMFGLEFGSKQKISAFSLSFMYFCWFSSDCQLQKLGFPWKKNIRKSMFF